MKYILIDNGEKKYIINKEEVCELEYKDEIIRIKGTGKKYKKEDYGNYEIINTCDYLHHIITDLIASEFYKKNDRSNTLQFSICNPNLLKCNLLFDEVVSKVIIDKKADKMYYVKLYENL